MECLEQLEKLDIEEVSKKTHVSILEIRAILNREFDSFNHSKALGFAKIFKRDYNIDLTPWLEEFVETTGAKEVQDEIFIIAKEKIGVDIKTRLFYLIIAIAVVAVVSLIYNTVTADSVPETVVENKEIIEEAKEAIVKNKEEEKKEALLVAAPAERLQPKVVEKKVEKVYIRSKNKLWLGIKNNKTGKTKNTIFQGEYEIDPQSDVTITFGHGYFTLVAGEKEEHLAKRFPQKYRYIDGRFEKLNYVPPKSKPKKVEPAVKAESEQIDVNKKSEAATGE